MTTPDTAVHALTDKQIEKLAMKYGTGLNFVRAVIAADRALRAPAAAPINQPEAVLRAALVSAETALSDIGDGEGPVYDRVSNTNRSWSLYQAEKRALQALPAVRAALAAAPPAPKEAP